MASGCVVLLPEFRLAPEHPHPAALEDALVIYRWLREHGPSGESKASFVSVAGESGGGGLTLSLMLALRDGNESLPSAAVTFSAVTDLSCSGDSMKTRAGADIMVVPSQVREAADLYRGNTDAKSPLASPVFADPKGLPPLLMQVGDAEVFLSDTTRFAERARAAGVEVTLEIWPEMFHAFQLCSPVLPEGREALERAGRFLREKESLPAL
jgi:acetyl esterase/lipase